MGRKILVPAGTAVVLVLAVCLSVAALTSHGDSPVSERTVGNMTMKAAPLPASRPVSRAVRFWADGASGKRAWTEVQFWACLSTTQTATVTDGKKMTFSVDWRTYAIKPGRYTVRGNFGVAEAAPAGNIPPVTIEIRS